MRIYSLLIVVLACLFSQGATAKTVTFKTNIDGSVNVIPSVTYTPVTVTEAGVAVDLGSNEGVNLSANQGYSITKVLNQEFSRLDESYIPSYELLDGDVITITTLEKQARSLKVIANAEQCYLSYNYTSYRADDQVDGAWIIPNVSDQSSVNVYANDGYALSKVVDQNNMEYDLSGPQTFYIGGSRWEGELVLTVTTYNLEEARDKSVTVKIEGDPSSVKISRYNYSEKFTPTSDEFVYKYMDSELPLTFEHSNYNLSLHKVWLNDNLVEKTPSGYFHVSPQDGDKITVQPESNIDVDINFNYSSDDIKDIISSITVNGDRVTDWDKEKLTVKQGSKVYFDFNSIDFENISASVNDTPITFPAYGYYYEFSADDESGYSFDISATAKKPYTVTVHAEDYDKIVVYNGSSYDLGDPIYLTQSETVLTVPVSNNYISIRPIDSNYIVNLNVNGSCKIVPYELSLVSVDGDDAYITVEVEKIERDKKIAIYLDDAEWISEFTYVLLSNFKATEYKQYLQSGYQIVNFGDFDNDVMFSLYGPNYLAPIAYYNGEPQSYLYTKTIEDGDILKAYMSEPESYSVTYDIEDGAAVKVYHDYLTLIENPSTHTVFANTEIHVKPEGDEKVKVEVNNTSIAPNEEGFYTATINGDTNVKVSIDSDSGIENVTGGNDVPMNVYNLQGIEVLHKADEAEIKALPAGIYVAGGKKIVIR